MRAHVEDKRWEEKYWGGGRRMERAEGRLTKGGVRKSILRQLIFQTSPDMKAERHGAERILMKPPAGSGLVVRLQRSTVMIMRLPCFDIHLVSNWSEALLCRHFPFFAASPIMFHVECEQTVLMYVQRLCLACLVYQLSHWFLLFACRQISQWDANRNVCVCIVYERVCMDVRASGT